MRTIDANALIEQMEADAEHIDDPICKMFAYAAVSDVKHAPTIEPKKMRGKWVKENIVLTSNPQQYLWHCSSCMAVVHGRTVAILPNFCPSCGADMRGTE